MRGKADITIWNGALNFRAYGIDKIVKLNDLKGNIERHKWNYDKKKEGWITDSTYFKSDDESITTYLYTTFRKDSRSSREVGHDIFIPEPVGLSFYFDKKLIIASTASDSTLHSKVEKKIFDTISPLWAPSGIGYSPDFIYWLAYKYDTKNSRVTSNIIIEDIRAISSEIEKFNLSGACSANTQVTSYTQAKSLLALNGQAKGARLVLRSNNEEYAFKFASDGRINSEKRDLEDSEGKVRYVLEIHNLLQEAYAEYIKIRDNDEWKNKRNEYRCKMIQDCIDDLSNLLSQIQNNKTP